MDQDSREKRFWNNYLALLVEHEIKPSMYPWQVRHCECFIRANEEIMVTGFDLFLPRFNFRLERPYNALERNTIKSKSIFIVKPSID